MAIIYKCAHCHQKIGKLENQVMDTAMLGFDQLTEKEKREMIQYRDDGNIYVQTICESCEQTLGEHPEYHELDFFIQ